MGYKEIGWKDYPSNSTLLTADNLDHMDKGIKEANDGVEKLQEMLKNIADIVYPVGAIYLSVSNVNPGNLFGGTWTQFAIGRTIIGINPDDEDFNNIEKTGGSKAREIAEENLPAHKHTFTPEGNVEYKKLSGSTEYTEDDETKHSHRVPGGIQFSKTTGSGVIKTEDAPIGAGKNIFYSEPEDGVHTDATGAAHNHSFDVSHVHTFTGRQKDTGYVGESKEMDILPPYVTCYIWKRIK